MHYFTESQRIFVKENVQGRTRKEMLELFNTEFGIELGLNQIVAFMKNNGFTNGLGGKFKKGQKSWNKGMKGLNLGGEKGWFKKGQAAFNYMPIGTERINGEGYTDIKIADPNIWEAKHRLLWKEANGPIPDGHVILFGDGDKQNVVLENLILISRTQLSILNSKNLIQSDVELTKIGIAVADIYTKISGRKKAK